MADDACQHCNKSKTVHVTEIKNGQKIEKHLCKDCPQVNEGMANTSHQPIDQLLSNFVMSQSKPAKQAKQCQACEMTWAAFKQGGLLGCEHDYDVFTGELEPLLKRAHEGATHHTGKVPARRGEGQVRAKRPSLGKLRRQLQEAVEAEDYEKAAALRDQLSTLEDA